MINYCVREQGKDYTRVKQSGASAQTEKKCKDRWGNDYGMVAACIRMTPPEEDEAVAYSPVPVGNPGGFSFSSTGASGSSVINGVTVPTCSHGGLCHGRMMRAITQGSP